MYNWSTLKKLIWLYATKLKGGAQAIIETITGTLPLVLQNALSHAILSLTRYGLCVQDGTPTPDTPVDILCNNGALKYGALGANLYDPSTAVFEVGYYYAPTAGGAKTAAPNNYIYNAYIPIEAGEAYVFYGRRKSGNNLSQYNRIHWYDAEKTYISTNAYVGGTMGKGVAPDNAAFARLSCNPQGLTTEITEETVLGYNWTFCKGTAEVTPFVPFVGGIYTDGEDEVLTVSGINLLDPSTSNIVIGQNYNANGAIINGKNNWRTGLIPITGGRTYAFCGRKKTDNTISAYNRINWYTENGTHIAPRPSYTVNTVTIATAPSNAAFAGLSCSAYDSDDAITRETFDEFNWMFAEASEEIPYQPYVTPQTVGWKNLFDASSYTEINAYVNANTGVLTTGSPGSMTQYCAVIPCKPNTQYSITGQGTSAWGAFTSDSIGTTATATTKGGNLTTGPNDRYLIGLVRANGDSIDYRNTLIVRETVTDIPMLLGVGDYKDTAELINGIKTGKVGVKAFDGTENWANISGYYNISKTDLNTNSTVLPQNSTSVICTHFVAKSGLFTDGVGVGGSYVNFKYDAIAATLDAWKTWLATQYAAGTPVIVLYPLATETTEQTTPQALHTVAGVNIVDSVANVSPVEAKVEYYASESTTPPLLGMMGPTEPQDEPQDEPEAAEESSEPEESEESEEI